MPIRHTHRVQAAARRTQPDLQRLHLALLPLVAGATGAGVLADTLAGGLVVFGAFALAVGWAVRTLQRR